MSGYIYQSGKPSLDTLVGDIYDYMSGKGEFPEPTDEQIDAFATKMAGIVGSRLKERRYKEPEGAPQKPFKLRMSNYGTPDRKLWFEANYGRGEFEPRLYLNFLIGDVWEAIIILLAQLTGHEVTNAQDEVEINGMTGHPDGVIDGVLIDVKSASKWSFTSKFAGGGLFEPGGDSFAYIPQIKAYASAMGYAKQAFVAANKETGELAVVRVPDHIRFDAPARVSRAQAIIAQPTAPVEKCYQPEPYGKSGNMTLNKNCSFCSFKEMCWADHNNGEGLRAFEYSSGPVYFTEVVNVPKVPEINLRQAAQEIEVPLD